MSTMNQVGVGLSGASGSGNFAGNVSPSFTTPALGTPSAGVLSSCTGYSQSALTGLGTGVSTALGINVGTAGSPVVNGGALGTPSSGTLSSCTGLPVSTGISGLGTGVATALATNVNGSGAIALTTSPTFVTPVLGAASATSINFGGTTLANYTEGSWTPVDASGASLSFSSASGSYTRIGNMVVATCTLTYPSTVDASTVSIGGLPITVSATTSKQGGGIVYSNVPTAIRASTTAGTITFSVWTAAGAGLINSAMSGSLNYFQLIYFV